MIASLEDKRLHSFVFFLLIDVNKEQTSLDLLNFPIAILNLFYLSKQVSLVNLKYKHNNIFKLIL